MIAAALIIAIVALVASVLCALAVMELIANRPHVTREDDALVEEFEVSSKVAGTAASSHGLPGRLDRLDRHLVLVVSPVCARCSAIAASLGGAIPDDLTVVVTASAPARMRAWCRDRGLPQDGVVFDDDMSIVGSLEVASSPTVVGFGGGRVVFAAGIGGAAALEDLLEQRARGLFAGDVADVSGQEWTRQRGGSSA